MTPPGGSADVVHDELLKAGDVRHTRNIEGLRYPVQRLIEIECQRSHPANA